MKKKAAYDLNDPLFKNVTQEETQEGKIFGEKKGSNLLVNCEIEKCCNQRWVKVADIKRHYGRFCSKSCAMRFKNEKRELNKKEQLSKDEDYAI